LNLFFKKFFLGIFFKEKFSVFSKKEKERGQKQAQFFPRNYQKKFQREKTKINLLVHFQPQPI